MFKCETCDKEFESQSKYAGHRSGHVRRGEVPKWVPAIVDHTCLVCGVKCESGHQLGGHMKLHEKSFEELRCDAARKGRLLTELGHQCQVCNNTEWLGVPVPIELDHIDGNPENNERSNLRLICPNCHAQTDTYKGRNMGKVTNSKRQQTLLRSRGAYR